MFDIAVIGGGPGGYVAAIKAAQKGMKTVLVEKTKLGGTCLNVGCIPTKSFLSDVKKLMQAKKSKVIVGSSQLNIDLKKMVNRKDNVVRTLVNGLESLIKSNRIQVVLGHGKIIDSRTIRVENINGKAQNFESRNIIIATGSRTSIPSFMKIDKKGIITSDEALSLNEVPGSIIIIGGGVIGVELGTIFNGLGSKVLILEMLADIIMTEDEEVRKGLSKILEREEIIISTNSKVTKVRTEKDSVIVSYTNNQRKDNFAKADKVLVSVGRVPNTEELGLERLGIHTDGKFIKVNGFMETNIKGIYAIGDVIGRKMLAHAASAEGEIAVENICGRKVAVNYSMIPNCIYTHPEIASVGLTEVEAKEKRLPVKIGKFPFTNSGSAWAKDEIDGFIKIIGNEKTGEILGVSILGERATDLISECLLAMSIEATVEDLGKVINGHPTLSEGIKEAALDWQMIPVHVTKNR